MPLGSTWTRDAASVALLVLASVVIREAYLLDTEVKAPVRADAVKYVRIAHNVVHRGIYSELPQATAHSAWIAPGYPLLLATIYAATDGPVDFYSTTLHLQAFLGALTVGCLYLLARLFMGRGPSIAAGVLAAALPHSITFSGYLLTETWFTFLLVLALLLLGLSLREARLGVAFWAAIPSLALAAATRPVVLMLPVVIAPLFWIRLDRPGRLEAAAGLAVCTVALRGPVDPLEELS